MDYTILIGLAATVAVAFFLLSKNKKKKKKQTTKQTKTLKQKIQIPQTVEKTPTPSSVADLPAIEEKLPEEGSVEKETQKEPADSPPTVGPLPPYIPEEKKEPVAGPVGPSKKTLEKEVPAGWFRAGNGFLYKNKDKNALWMPEIARKTRKLDLSKFDAIKNLTITNTHRPTKNNATVFSIRDESFKASIAGNTLSRYGVLYLCDADGWVHDFCIQAIGAPSDGQFGNERNIVYLKGSFKQLFVVQVSDGEGLNAIYTSASIMSESRRNKLKMNTKIFLRSLP